MSTAAYRKKAFLAVDLVGVALADMSYHPEILARLNYLGTWRIDGTIPRYYRLQSMIADLFSSFHSGPPGFRYERDVVAPAAQLALIDEIGRLPLQAFDFHGFKANRRVISYGWRYDFTAAKLVQIEPVPEWLLPLREAVAQFSGDAAEDFAQVLISEYAPGAGIGWHKDKAVFDRIVGVSLGATCPLRLRQPLPGGKWRRAEQVLEPGSMYLLSGEVRTAWEHSIAPVQHLRYSLTFRTLKP